MSGPLCCCGCHRPADGPAFSTPHDATNRYRGGRQTAWASECWQRNVEYCERIRAQVAAQTTAAIANATGVQS